jgi:four helix bundle protein
MAGHNIKELIIWQKAFKVSVEAYLVTKEFQKNETYDLTSQIKKSAVSIPSNIAEGFGRKSPNELKNFLSIANGSSNELITQLLIAQELGLANPEKIQMLEEKIIEVQKMIRAFQNKF